jgi:hypothetical protein
LPKVTNMSKKQKDSDQEEILSADELIASQFVDRLSNFLEAEISKNSELEGEFIYCAFMLAAEMLNEGGLDVVALAEEFQDSYYINKTDEEKLKMN